MSLALLSAWSACQLLCYAKPAEVDSSFEVDRKYDSAQCFYSAALDSRTSDPNSLAATYRSDAWLAANSFSKLDCRQIFSTSPQSS